MEVKNIHQRELKASVSEVGVLIDRLASTDDGLWPHDRWPRMMFDRPLEVGAIGGHGPIRYSVEAYEPGRAIRFRFSEPKGFVGTHRFEVEEEPGVVALRHVIEMRTVGKAALLWALVIRPLHDALVEDALDRAETFAGGKVSRRAWSPWVRLLRWMMVRAHSAARQQPMP